MLDDSTQPAAHQEEIGRGGMGVGRRMGRGDRGDKVDVR